VGKAVTALVPWFGSNRTNAHLLTSLVGKCKMLCIPFVGGFCEVLHIPCNSLLVCDRHRRLILLAKVVADPDKCDELIKELDSRLFAQDTLKSAQDRLSVEFGLYEDVKVAADYFYCCWATRNGLAGTGGELKAGLSYRLDGEGGDSCKRYRSAVEALSQWHAKLKTATILNSDGIAVIEKLSDRESTAVYADPPWPEDGDPYTHPFSPEEHIRLRDALLRFDKTCIVVRYGKHPLIEDLYPQSLWQWHSVQGRTSANRKIGSKEEVLLKRIR